MKKIILILSAVLSFHTFSITQSIPATGELWQSVVFFKIPLRPSSNPEDGETGYCNGTLLSASKLITAAHCFLNASISKQNPLIIEIGSYRFVDRNGQRVNVGYTVTSQFRVTGVVQAVRGPVDSSITEDPDNDLAIMTFDAPLSLPSPFYFLPVWKGALPLQSMIQGFYVVSVNPLTTLNHSNTRQIGTLNDISILTQRLESRGGSQVEPGDSGAPLTMMYQNQVYLIGVTKGHGESWMSSWDVFTLLAGRLL